MTEDTLVNTLLSLGEIGKDFQGSVGGFGKAKEILYFAHRNYTSTSSPHRVEGSGAGYDLGHDPGDTLYGTRRVVEWDGLVADELRAAFTRFVELAGPGNRVRYKIDGGVVKPKHRPWTWS